MKILVQSLVKIQTATPNGKVYENGWCSLMATTWMWEFGRKKKAKEPRAPTTLLKPKRPRSEPPKGVRTSRSTRSAVSQDRRGSDEPRRRTSGSGKPCQCSPDVRQPTGSVEARFGEPELQLALLSLDLVQKRLELYKSAWDEIAEILQRYCLISSGAAPVVTGEEEKKEEPAEEFDDDMGFSLFN
ncbi:60S acidic ribosomal protein family [Actinidia rufa]|uniref:60S acidic ribosomal protein family n=1 Tax=Actinidia rufa TaxID=165716 RepID=A0A7J0EY66_9ERIC|nr:60S acidic ribosomal protein family [Actinidia rufa]